MVEKSTREILQPIVEAIAAGTFCVQLLYEEYCPPKWTGSRRMNATEQFSGNFQACQAFIAASDSTEPPDQRVVTAGDVIIWPEELVGVSVSDALVRLYAEYQAK